MQQGDRQRIGNMNVKQMVTLKSTTYSFKFVDPVVATTLERQLAISIHH